jgi:FkbM family methyltransferase
MSELKRIFKRNTHNFVLKPLAGFGRALNRMYENRNHDMYSNGEKTVLEKLSKLNPKVIIDGGANTGCYSLLVSKLMPTTSIFSFEPVKSTFEDLEKTVNGCENITLINKGLYKDKCSKEINIYPSNTHSSLFDIKRSSDENSNKQTISLIKGDDFLNEQQINEVDLLKIDVEGAEYDALLGFEEHIKAKKIKMVQFEYGYINITTRKLLIDFYDFFEKHGYILGKIYPKTVEFKDYHYKLEDFLGPNIIAVSNNETELINLLKKK